MYNKTFETGIHITSPILLWKMPSFCTFNISPFLRITVCLLDDSPENRGWGVYTINIWCPRIFIHNTNNNKYITDFVTYH